MHFSLIILAVSFFLIFIVLFYSILSHNLAKLMGNHRFLQYLPVITLVFSRVTVFTNTLIVTAIIPFITSLISHAFVEALSI